MGFDRWGVMPGPRQEEFILAFQDLNTSKGKPFMSTSQPMSEDEIRVKLKKMGVSQAQADAAIGRAKTARTSV